MEKIMESPMDSTVESPMDPTVESPMDSTVDLIIKPTITSSMTPTINQSMAPTPTPLPTPPIIPTVISVIGCRPDVIRYASIIKKFDAVPNIRHLIVHTGQHYDPLLSDVFFTEFGIRAPDFNLECGKHASNHYEQLSIISVKFPELMIAQEFDKTSTIIFFLGDTNSVLGSIPLKKMGYKIGRIECFMRSYDDRMLEETNRKIADQVGDLFFCYTELNKQIALKENVTKPVYIVGNTIVEAVEGIKSELVGNKLKDRFLIDIHRPENTKDVKRVKWILEVANNLMTHFGIQGHLLYFKSLNDMIVSNNLSIGSLVPHDLMPYKEYMKFVNDSLFIISDSGTAQEEACMINTPCLVPRDFTERPQSYEYGCSFKISPDMGIDTMVNYITNPPVPDISWLYPPTGKVTDNSTGKVTDNSPTPVTTSELIVFHTLNWLNSSMTPFIPSFMPLSQISINDNFLNTPNYLSTFPYPHLFQDNFIKCPQTALQIQTEILNLFNNSPNLFDRYDNPFEQKFTLRDKSKYPPTLKILMDYLISPPFIQSLSTLTGHKLIVDTDKNFYGVHVYEPNDKLDIHVDAGVYWKNGLKKQVTLGIYFSYNWSPDNGCELEIWDGDSLDGNNYETAKLKSCITKIVPQFNRMILFNCYDNSWHGNPEPMKGSPSSRRIFVTLSYLSNDHGLNQKAKALFIARPTDPYDPVKDLLRMKRADPEGCKEIYRMGKKIQKDIPLTVEYNFIYMDTYASLALKYCDFSNQSPIIIFDIGSKDGHDARFLKNSIPNSVAYGFEAHPVEYERHKHLNTDINWINKAVFNYNGKLKFYTKTLGSGIHSARDRGEEFGTGEIEVDCVRIDTFCNEKGIIPNVVKIDVEGCTMEVLESFGSLLSKVDILHIETEEKEYFKGQVLEKEVFDFLEKNNFRKIFFTYVPEFYQHDSVWINLF